MAGVLELAILKAVDPGAGAAIRTKVHVTNARSNAIVCSRDKSGNLQQVVPCSDGMYGGVRCGLY
jgi:hypothetical protein